MSQISEAKSGASREEGELEEEASEVAVTANSRRAVQRVPHLQSSSCLDTARMTWSDQPLPVQSMPSLPANITAPANLTGPGSKVTGKKRKLAQKLPAGPLNQFVDVYGSEVSLLR